MNAAIVLALAGGLLAGAVALFGAGILITGRAPARTRKAFRSVNEAGLYSLCTGLGTVLLVVAVLISPPLSLAVLAVAVLLSALAFVRFRPRNPVRH